MSWARRPTTFAREVTGDHRTQCVRAGLEILSRVVLATPVESGRARGNWQTALGQIPGGDIERTDPSGAATISDGSRTIMGAPTFPKIHIANNLPYIGALNYGKPPGTPHSRKAPLLFVESAAQGVMDEL